MLIWIDGFDHYGTGEQSRDALLSGVYAERGNNVEVSSARPRSGLRSLRLPITASNFSRRVFGANKTTVGLGFAFWLQALPGEERATVLADFRNSANESQVRVSVSPVGEIVVEKWGLFGAAAEIARSGQVVTAESYQHFEIKIFSDSTNGAVEVRLNGVTIINESDVDTTNSNSSNTSYAQWAFRSSSSTAGVVMYIDDVFAWDLSGDYNNDFLGDKKVGTIFPNQDTAQDDWTLSEGSNGFALIGTDTPDDDTFIEAGDSGDISEFELSSVDANAGDILGVMTYTRMYKTDSGDNQVQVGLISNGQAAVGADRPITTEASYYQDIFEENPDTNAPWTAGDVNAALIRFERTL